MSTANQNEVRNKHPVKGQIKKQIIRSTIQNQVTAHKILNELNYKKYTHNN